MKLNWTLYISLFKDLLANGWIVVRDGKTSIYWWVNPYAEEPTKLYYKEACRTLHCTKAVKCLNER